MTLPTNDTHATINKGTVTKDRHVSRNGADRGAKKSGGGKGNWGTYEEEVEEAIEEVRASAPSTGRTVKE
ncbi:hypothetical protein H9P43_004656 [Blastocladiella emersonii ATCC 22665]|nr:hypothetical protein H9P43_004656 [Blastocladiella emersonii ATCC 22665]